MKRILFATAVASLFAACASAPEAKTTDQLMLGKWLCETSADGMKIQTAQTFVAGGTSTFDVGLSGDASGMAMDIKGSGTSEWKLLEDGKVADTVKTLKVASGKVNGQDVPPAMIQGMIEGMIVNQTSTTSVKFEGDTMVLVDDEGVVTNCKR